MQPPVRTRTVPSKRTAIELRTERPALVAIGPTAAAVVARGHCDLELADLLVAHGPPAPGELDWLTWSGVLRRSFAVALFDLADEAHGPVSRDIVRALSASTEHPVWFVVADSRRAAGRRRTLCKVADELGVCAIDPGELDVLDVALMGVAGLSRSGLTGFDIADVVAFARRGSVGVARRADEVAVDEEADRGIVVMRCSNETTLQAINDVVKRVCETLPRAELLVATPHAYPTSASCVLSIR